MELAQISLLLVCAAAFGIVAKLLRQPLLVGYFLAGAALVLLGLITDTQEIESLGKVGVTLLLFLVGLEMNIKELPSVGKVAFLTGLGQIIFTGTAGFVIAILLGFAFLPAIYIAIALTFSSTIIAVKLLSEKNDLNSLYGKISVGLLLVQDLVAVLLLIFLSSLGTGSFTPLGFVFVFLKAGLLLAVVLLLSKKALPFIFEKFTASSQELLFVTSIAWALGLASLVAGPLGLTLEIGGFVAGLALSGLPEHLQLASKVRPLRDFFLTIFFLVLGTKLVVEGVGTVIPAAIVLSLFVLVSKPLIVIIVMALLGYRKRTSFLSGLTVAQISEFSLIIAAMGGALGHLNQVDVALIVLVGIITMTGSTYFILGADKFYKILKRSLSVFERKRIREIITSQEVELDDHIVLIGCGRKGKALVSFFKRRDLNLVVLDFNPSVVQKLIAERVNVIFGDVSDPEILNLLKLDKARLLISTVTDLYENRILLEHLKSVRGEALSIFSAPTKKDALALYEWGATLVVVPEIITGEYLRHLLFHHGTRGEKLKKIGKSNFERLLKYL